MAAPTRQANANVMEVLGRVVGFAEDVLKTTRRPPDGPQPSRIGPILPKSGQMWEAVARVARGREIALEMSDVYVVMQPVDLTLGDTSNGPDAAVEEAKAMTEFAAIDLFAGVDCWRSSGRQIMTVRTTMGGIRRNDETGRIQIPDAPRRFRIQ